MPRGPKDIPAFKRQFRAVPIQAGRRYRARHKRQRLAGDLKFAGLAMIGAVTVGIGAAWIWPKGNAVSQPVAADTQQPQMSICGAEVRRTCVVDGDTIWLRSEKIRIADIDTPEVSQPRCEFEYQLGMKATYRLRDLLNEGPWSVVPIGNRDEDDYGRKLRVLTRDGQSIGDMLVTEGLAQSWTGRREPWC